MAQLAGAGAFAAESRQMSAARRVLLHPVVAPVGHIQIPGGVNADAGRHFQVGRAAALAAEPAQQIAVLAELLHPAGAGRHYPQVVVGVKSQPGGAAELPLAAAAFAPLLLQVAFRVKHGNLVFPFVRGIDIAVGIGGNAGQPGEQAAGTGLIGDAFPAEFPDIFLVHGKFGDAGAGILLAGTVGDIQHAVGPRRDADRLAEPHTHLSVAANVVAVQPRPPARYGIQGHFGSSTEKPLGWRRRRTGRYRATRCDAIRCAAALARVGRPAYFWMNSSLGNAPLTIGLASMPSQSSTIVE